MNEQSNFITLMVGYPIQRLNDVTNEKEWIKGEPFLVTINLNHIVSISTMKGTNQTCIVMQHSDGDGDNVVYYTDIEQKKITSYLGSLVFRCHELEHVKNVSVEKFLQEFVGIFDKYNFTPLFSINENLYTCEKNGVTMKIYENIPKDKTMQYVWKVLIIYNYTEVVCFGNLKGEDGVYPDYWKNELSEYNYKDIAKQIIEHINSKA